MKQQLRPGLWGFNARSVGCLGRRREKRIMERSVQAKEPRKQTAERGWTWEESVGHEARKKRCLVLLQE